MARVSISEAARLTGVSRVTLHRYIKSGRLTRLPDGRVDTADLSRAGLSLQLETPPVDVTGLQPVIDSPLDYQGLYIASLENRVADLQRQCEMLQGELETVNQRYDSLFQMLQAKDQMLQEMLHPLLQAPRQLPDADRGEMRRRILDLLRDHPEGLTPAGVRRLLGADKDLNDTMRAMARDGLLVRLTPGVYVRHHKEGTS